MKAAALGLLLIGSAASAQMVMMSGGRGEPTVVGGSVPTPQVSGCALSWDVPTTHAGGALAAGDILGYRIQRQDGVDWRTVATAYGHNTDNYTLIQSGSYTVALQIDYRSSTGISTSARSDSASVTSCSPSFGVEGYGASVTGGVGGTVATVSNLLDSGSGSLRQAILDAENAAAPYIINFSVGGNLDAGPTNLASAASNLTIDGCDAPYPGITLLKNDPTPGDADGTSIMVIRSTNTALTSNVIVRCLKAEGLWDENEGPDTEGDSTISVDGDFAFGVTDVVFQHITVNRARDAGPDWYGKIDDSTFQNMLVSRNKAPTTITHAGTDVRNRLSFHHNAYLLNRERNPQVRGHTFDLDIRNNVVYGWGHGAGNGYGMRFRAWTDGTYPSGINVVNNVFLGGAAANSCVELGENLGDENPWPEPIWINGNSAVAGCTDVQNADSTVGAEIDLADVTTHTVAQLDAFTLSRAGAPYPTAQQIADLDTAFEALYSRLNP